MGPVDRDDYEQGFQDESWVMSILRNEKQLLADKRNVNNLGRIWAALHNQVTRKQLSQKHKECDPARMCMDEQAVQDLILCMREFGCFPFDPALPILRILQSAPLELIHDFQTAREDWGGGGLQN